MPMLMLKRLNVPLDRDVIFLAEAGEEGDARTSASQFMVEQHFDAIDAEYCLAEGGGVTRIGGEREVRDGRDAGEDSARHRDRRARASPATAPSRCKSNASRTCRAPSRRSANGGRELRFNETTGPYFRRLAAICPPDDARNTTATCCPTIRRCARPADDWLFENEPMHSSMLRTSVVAEHHDRRLPLQRDPVRSEGDARRPRAARRGSDRSSSSR